MLTGYHVLFGMLLASALGGAPAERAELTIADIPADVSPQLKALIEQTFSSNARTRAQAARKIGELHEPASDAVPFLMQLNDDTDIDGAGVRFYYVDEALVAIGEPALRACLDALNTKSRAKLFRVCQCLANFKAPLAMEALLNLAKSPYAMKRQAAIEALSGCVDPRANLSLIEALNDIDGEVRARAVYGFLHIRFSGAAEPLLRLLQNDVPPLQRLFQNDDSLRHIFIQALGNQRDPRAIPALLKILRNPEEAEWDRHFAAKSLGMIGGQTNLPTLVEICRDQNERTTVRSGAVMGIGVYRASAPELPLPPEHGERILALLVDLMNDDREPLALRVSAAQALGELGNNAAVKSLTQKVDLHNDDELAYRAALSIVKLTHGDIRDTRIVTAIKNYHRRIPLFDSVAKHERFEAMQKLPRTPHLGGHVLPQAVPPCRFQATRLKSAWSVLVLQLFALVYGGFVNP